MTTQIDEKQLRNEALTYASFRTELGYWDETQSYSAGTLVRWHGKIYKALNDTTGGDEGDLTNNPEDSNDWVLAFDPQSSLVRKVKALADSNIDLTQTVSSVDGITLSTGDKVFLNGQTDSKENGYYELNSSGYLVRENKLGAGANIDGTAFFVLSGNTYPKTFWLVSASDVVGTGEINATKITGAAGTTYTFTNGITESSGTVKLGGTLTEDTNLDNATNNVTFSIGQPGGTSYSFDYNIKTHQFHAVETTGSSTVTIMPTYITLQQFDGVDFMKLTFERSSKTITAEKYVIKYADDYSAQFDARTITDKGYVDFRSRTIAVKVFAGTSIDLSNTPSTIDGVSLAVNDLVALFDQSTTTQDGIYIVTAVDTTNNTATLTRWSYTPSGFDLSGFIVNVLQGNTYGNKAFFVQYPAVIGTNDVTYYELHTPKYTFTNGLTENLGTVKLGGSITEDTTLDTTVSGKTFSILGASHYIQLNNTTSILGQNDNSTYVQTYIQFQNSQGEFLLADYSSGTGKIMSITLNKANAGILVRDDIGSQGLYYAADYHAKYKDRSIPDKGYVDFRSRTIAVTVFADSNIDLTNAPTSIDGKSLAAGDLVALFNQTTTSEDGIYVVTSVSSTNSTLTRWTYTPVGFDLSGYIINVLQGTNNGNKSFFVNYKAVIGTDDITYYKLTSVPYTFTNGLSESNKVVKLGGTLTEDTSISGGYNFVFETNSFTASASTVTLSTNSGTDTSSLTLSSSGFVYSDGIAGKGLVYAADYHTNYDDRTVPDKGYVDFRSRTIAVRVLSDTSIDPTAGPLTIDGVTLAVGDLVALFNQSTTSDDGIYVVTSVGTSNTTLSRWSYTPTGFDLSGFLISVLEGSNYGNKAYYIQHPAVIGTNDIQYYRASAINYNFYNGVIQNDSNVGLGGNLAGPTTISLDNGSTKYGIEFLGQNALLHVDDYSNAVNIAVRTDSSENETNGKGSHINLATDSIQFAVVDATTGVPGIVQLKYNELDVYLNDGIKYQGPTYSSNTSNNYWIPDKQYVDSHGDIIRVDLRAVGNIDLTNVPTTIDGVTVATGMVVALFDQSTTSQDGIYVANVVSGVVHLDRHYSFPEGESLHGRLVYVFRGTTYGGKLFKVTNTTNNAVIGTDDIAVSEYYGGPADNITGSGAATQLAFFTDTTELSSDPDLYWQNDYKYLVVNKTLGTSGRSNYVVISNAGESPTPSLAWCYYAGTTGTTPAGTWAFRMSGSSRPVSINYFDDPIVYITPTKKVGVLTTSPSVELDVAGSGRFTNNLTIGSSSGINLNPTYGVQLLNDTASALFDLGVDSKFVFKYNAEAGTGEHYQASDIAIKMSFGETDSTMKLYSAPSGSAGDTITWTELLNVSDTTFTYKGLEVITEDPFKHGYDIVTANTNLATGDYAIAVFKQNGPSAGYAQIFILDSATGWCGILHVLRSGSIHTIWFENSVNSTTSTPPITAFYVKSGTASDGSIIYATVANSTNSFSVRLLNVNVKDNLILKNFVPSGTDPGDVNFTNIVGIVNECKIPDPNVGFTLGRDIYIGYPTAHRVLTTADLTTIDDKYVNVTGDTMTGDLILHYTTLQFTNATSDQTLYLERAPNGGLQLRDTQTGVEGGYLFLVPGSSGASIGVEATAPVYLMGSNLVLQGGTLSSDSGIDLKLKTDTTQAMFIDQSTQYVAFSSSNTSPSERIDADGFIKATEGHIINRGSVTIAAGTTADYYRIGVGASRSFSTYIVRYMVSGYHGELMFSVGDMFGYDTGYMFTLYYYSYYGGVFVVPIVRFAEAGTSDDMYVDIYIKNPSSTADLTVEILQLTRGIDGFDMPSSITTAPDLDTTTYNAHTFSVGGKQFMTRNFSVDTAGNTYTSNYFQPGVGYKSSDGSIGVNTTLNLLGSDKTTQYTLVIKDGLITQVTSTTIA